MKHRKVETTEVQLERILLNYETLGETGFTSKRGKDLIEDRHALFHQLEEIGMCRAWIQLNCEKRKTYNINAGSYKLKHRIEDDLYHYITNGACITAFIIEGYDLKLDVPNCIFSARCIPKF